MRSLCLSASGVLLAASPALDAQVDPSVSLSTHSVVGVFARAGREVVLKSEAAGTKLPHGLVLEAAVRGAAAATRAELVPARDERIGVVVTESAEALQGGEAGTTSSDAVARLSPGRHSFLMRISAAPMTKGKVVIAYEGRVTDEASAAAAVDIGNDGSFEFQEKAGKLVRKEFPVTIGKEALPVRIVTEALTRNTQNDRDGYRATLGVFFEVVDEGCTITAYGKGCGPALKGTSRSSAAGHEIMLSLSHAAGDAFGLMVFGDRKEEIRIPGTDCLLLENLVRARPFRTDGKGEATEVLRIPDTRERAFNVQGLVFGMGRHGLLLTTSHALHVECR